MPRLDLIVDDEALIADRTEPDFVVALASALKLTPVNLQQTLAVA
jgi:hypothetical protein